MPLEIFVAHPSALLTDHRAHGDGLVVFGFIRELAARGHVLHVAAERVDLRASLPPNVHLYRLGADGARGPAGRIAFMGRMGRLYRRLAQRTTFDVVHQFNPVDAGLSLAVRDRAVPVVLGPFVPDWPGHGARGAVVPRLKLAIRAAQQRRATTALLSTPAAAAKLSRRRTGGLHLYSLSAGIDVEAWAPPAGAGQREPGHILFLANLQARKGILVMLEAFAELAGVLPGARLTVAGDGPLAAEVRQRVEALPDPGRVRLLGAVTRAEAPFIMQNCSVFCLPSFGEPFGMTALEAMACAKPVVATDAGGLRHLLPDRGGRKVAPGDAPALAAALAEIVQAPDLGRAMGEHNRRIVEEQYAWTRVVDRLEEIYREAIARPRRHSKPSTWPPMNHRITPEGP